MLPANSVAAGTVLRGPSCDGRVSPWGSYANPEPPAEQCQRGIEKPFSIPGYTSKIQNTVWMSKLSLSCYP